MGQVMTTKHAAALDEGDFTDAEKSEAAKAIMRLLDEWSLSQEEQQAILGLQRTNRESLNGYRKGRPIGTSIDQFERVGHVFAINTSLRILFPESRETAAAWMRLPNRAFNGASAAQLVCQRGFVGLLQVRLYLDRMRGI